MRTDNDVSKVPKHDLKNLAGINRCMKIAKLEPLPHYTLTTTANGLVDIGVWLSVSEQINPMGIYLSKVDLESDLSIEMPNELKTYSGKDDIDDAVKYLQDKKAIRMREFLLKNKASLKNIAEGELVKPLLHSRDIVKGLY